MTAVHPTFEHLFESLGVSAGDFTRDINHTPGNELCYLMEQYLKILELTIENGGSTLDKFGAIMAINRSENLQSDLGNKITSYIQEIIAADRTDLAIAAMQLIGKSKKQIKQNFPLGINIDSDSDYEYDSDALTNLPLEEQERLIELAGDYQDNPTVVTASGFFEGLAKSTREDTQVSRDPDSPRPLYKHQGFDSQSDFVSFETKNDATNAFLDDVFNGMGGLVDTDIDEELLLNEFDIAVNRVLNEAYAYTGNKVSNMPEFVALLQRFEGSENEYKADLYSRLIRILTYVLQYDVTRLGLNVEYPSLRLSQVIPNYFLKRRGFVLDASACSSGKSGTILIAPAEVDAKRTVVLVENSTYGDILNQFQNWYQPRKDFLVIGKQDFWNQNWLTLDKKVIVVLDKSFLSNIDDKERRANGQETFASWISRIGIDLLIGDEVHNFKGAQSGTVQKDFYQQDEEEVAFTICAGNFAAMAKRARYRLFCSATPMLNDFSEPAKLLRMLLPAPHQKTAAPRYHHLSDSLRSVKDKADKTERVLENGLLVYRAFKVCSTRVPNPTAKPTIIQVSNENLRFEPRGTDPQYGRVVGSRFGDLNSWTRAFFDHIDDRDLRSRMSNSACRDAAFVPFYLALMRKQVVQELKAGNQISFFTNSTTQNHEQIKEWVLNIAADEGIALTADEVVIANGTNQSFRDDVTVTLDDGTTITKRRLATQVWDRSCKVLITNYVTSVGFDGLQGTDQIEDCGRISVVFELINTYTKAHDEQNRARYLRTQGSDSTLFPEVTIYKPYLVVNCDPESDEEYCRTEETDARLTLKGTKATLMTDGEFPEGIDMQSFIEINLEGYRDQFRRGIFGTEEGQEERERNEEAALEAAIK